MPDYGHTLEFATFPEPLYMPPQAAVELALLSESWGYDLVAFQDHPYISDYLEIWTLMSWVAARTNRIRVASNVLNLGLRSPAIAARSAATIDLLSDGRFELGLGAGNRWDDIAAMGADRLGSSDGIQALDEAIDIIRGAWETDVLTPLSVDGEFHSVSGMSRGPAGAHRIPVWIGAYKPRMLRLAARKADAWTAGLGSVMSRAQWQSASSVIDEAAEEAGRSPSVIRRIAGITGDFTSGGTEFLRGPTGQWVEQLLPSVLEDGVGTFIVATDHHPTLQRFAADVIPALRDAVAAERQS